MRAGLIKDSVGTRGHFTPNKQTLFPNRISNTAKITYAKKKNFPPKD